jgi:hypothetical protein
MMHSRLGPTLAWLWLIFAVVPAPLYWIGTDVLKRIDGELSRTGTDAAAVADVHRRDSTSKAGDGPNQRGLEGSTFR